MATILWRQAFYKTQNVDSISENLSIKKPPFLRVVFLWDEYPLKKYTMINMDFSSLQIAN